MTQSWLDFIGYILLFSVIGICAYIYLKSDDFELKCIVSGVDGNK